MLLFVTPDQAATVGNVSPRTVRNLIDRGELKAIRVGRLWRIPTQSLAEYLHITPEQIAEVLNAA